MKRLASCIGRGTQTSKKGYVNSPAYILAVNDTQTVLDIVTEHLESAGFEVTPVRTGRQAVEACRSRRPDLILLDYNLKADGDEMTAEDFIPAFKESRPGVPIVVMSVTDKNLSEKKLGIAATVSCCSNNGYDWTEVVDVVRRNLRRDVPAT
jgi:CheY-like chemotaxis protein